MMAFRTQCYAALDLKEPAMYLDADMVCVRSLDLEKILGDATVGLCRRQYELGRPAFGEAMRTVGQVWPYVGCCAITRGPEFWADCSAHIATLDPERQSWYGDQYALAHVAASGKYTVRDLPESVYAHLPEMKSGSSGPRLLHFKGPDRKSLMAEWATRNLPAR